MVTPIETGMSVFNADHMSNQVKDPNTTHVMGAQLQDVRKENEQRSQTVQALENADAFIRIGDAPEKKERERRQDARGREEGKDERSIGAKEERNPPTSKGFSLIA